MQLSDITDYLFRWRRSDVLSAMLVMLAPQIGLYLSRSIMTVFTDIFHMTDAFVLGPRRASDILTQLSTLLPLTLAILIVLRAEVRQPRLRKRAHSFLVAILALSLVAAVGYQLLGAASLAVLWASARSEAAADLRPTTR